MNPTLKIKYLGALRIQNPIAVLNKKFDARQNIIKSHEGNYLVK